MIVIQATTVDEALLVGLRFLRANGVEVETRNGPALVSPIPVTTHYVEPQQRVLFNPERDANPFFHLYEALWMLAGRNDVASVERYVKRMRQFSDDGFTLHGAYGHRWRHHWSFDQLSSIISALRESPNCRRQVLTMWDPEVDLERQGRDVPCNLVVHFQRSPVCPEQLNMTVFCRSNDVVWGAYGANAVHFSYLHEYVATCAGFEMGEYWQVSDNYHVYPATAPDTSKLDLMDVNRYADARDPVRPFPLIYTNPAYWHRDLALFMEGVRDSTRFWDPFFSHVAAPLMRAHERFRHLPPSKRFDAAYAEIQQCKAEDWQRAAMEWVRRRELRYERAKDDGVRYE